MTGGTVLHASLIEAAWIPSAAFFRMGLMNRTERLKCLRFRSQHRGVREADLLVGGYFERWHSSWTDADMDWFEALLEEQDVDILAWAMGTAPAPERWRGEMMNRLQAIDYVKRSD
jgi:antitoxin CptB